MTRCHSNPASFPNPGITIPGMFAARIAKEDGQDARPPRRQDARPPIRRGAVLLEVLVSLGLMVFGLAVVGLRVSTSLESARKSQIWTTAVVLTETKMAELQAGAVAFKPTDQQIGGYFGIRFPGYSWRIEIEPCEIQDLYLMTLKIGYNPSVIDAQIANPDTELDFEDDAVKVVRTVYRLVPKPADLDLNRDFGIDLQGMQDKMAGGGQGGQGGTGGQGGQGGEGGEGGQGGGDSAMSELWGLINDFLTKHPEILNDSGGIDLEAIKNLPAEDFQMAMNILQQFVGRGSQLSQLQEQLGENLEGGGQGGRGGQSGRGGQNGRSGQNNQGGRGAQGNTDNQNGGSQGGGNSDQGQNANGNRPGRNSDQGDQNRDGGRNRNKDNRQNNNDNRQNNNGNRQNNNGNQQPPRR